MPLLFALALWRRGVFVWVLVLALGVAWAGARARWILAESLSNSLEGNDIVLEGTIDTIPRPASYGQRFDFRVDKAWAGGKPVVVPHRIRLRADRTVPIRVGERWQFTARLKRPHGYQNPGGFDYEAYLFELRIRAVGYVRAARRLGPSTPGYGVARVRAHLATRIRELAGSSPNAGVLTALVTGDRSAIRPEQWRLFRATGTSHLMAISGLHVGLVSGIVFTLASWLWRRTLLRRTLWPTPRVAALAAWVAALGYSLLAGLSLPTQRALLMLSIFLGGTILGRRYRPGAVLAGALTMVLLWDPLSVMSPGFWLSFAAVGAIYMMLYARGQGGQLRFSLVRIQWAIGLVLAPLSLLWFQQLSLSAPLANLAAVPLFAVIIVPATLTSVLLDVLGLHTVGAHLLSVDSWFLDRLWFVLRLLARMPMWVRASPGDGTVVAGIAGVCILLLPRPMPARWLGGLCLLPLVFAPAEGPAAGQMDLALLDVGQGLAVVVRTHRHLLVFDTGPRLGRDFDTGEAVLVPYLRYVGAPSVDELIVSHGDNDHIGGAQSVRQLMRVKQTLSGVPRRLPGAIACRAGQTWRWDDVSFRMLSPDSANPMSHNNHSCVLQIQSLYGSVLLPADIEARRERELVARLGKRLRADVLIAPHHGSRTSSTEEFIDAVQPRWVLFPVGYRNRYHHPNPAVLERYRKRGVHLLGSPGSGTITVRFRPSGLRIERFRVDSARYWFDRPSFAP